jgi:hypothetical protein
MKKLVETYSFDASEKKVTLTNYNPLVIERLLIITNITDNVIIYLFSDATKGGTAATNVVTLTYDTSTMDDTDKLQIFYDDVPATGTSTNVASSASSVTLLAANTSRFGAMIFNDSTAVLYVKLGATASATSYTVKMDAGDYFEVPYEYTGIIDGIWASATGSARITEVT